MDGRARGVRGFDGGVSLLLFLRTPSQAMTFSPTLLVILLMACSLSPWSPTAAQEAKADAEGPLDTPVYGVAGKVPVVALARLLAVPERFEGPQIRVCGFVLQHLD